MKYSLFCSRLLRNGLVLIIGLLPLMAAADTLQRIKDTNTFTIGFVANYAPFSDGNTQSASGYTIELCQQIGERLKQQLDLPSLKLRYQPVSIEDMLNAVKSAQIDILCSPIDETLQRRETVSFSLPVMISGLGVVLRRDAPAFLLERVRSGPGAGTPLWRGNVSQQLNKFRFVVLGSTNSEDWARQQLRRMGLKSILLTVDTSAEGIQMVSSGKADAFFDDRLVLLNRIAQAADGDQLLVPERLFAETPAALAIGRGDEDFRLLVDRSISELLHSPQGIALYQKYFGEPSEQTRLLFRLYPKP